MTYKNFYKGALSTKPGSCHIGSTKVPHVSQTSVLFIFDQTEVKNSAAYFSYPLSNNEIATAFIPPAEIPVITS